MYQKMRDISALVFYCANREVCIGLFFQLYHQLNSQENQTLIFCRLTLCLDLGGSVNDESGSCVNLI